jgi:MOSC domain-containing protein YiiM
MTLGQVSKTDMASNAVIQSIFIAPKSLAPVVSLEEATLLPGLGIKGDRYALQTGTYSARFLQEPGRNLTMISADGVEATMSEKGMRPFESGMGALRRNLVIRGLTAEAVNDMIGHEVTVGAGGVRLFVHRSCVPCKLREAQTQRPGLMLELWDVCGVNCEVVQGGVVRVGDSVAVIPGTHQPQRVNRGSKPPAFFIKPSERSAEQAKAMVMSPRAVAIRCFVDPAGFQRLADAYGSFGMPICSTKSFEAAMCAKTLRTPLLATAGVALLAIAVGAARKVWAWRI